MSQDNPPRHEDEVNPSLLGLLDVKFREAYDQQMAQAVADYVHIPPESEGEFVSLVHTKTSGQRAGESKQYTLGRPKLGANIDTEIAFWVDRKAGRPDRSDERPLRLVITNDDPSRFYNCDHDGYPILAEALDPEESFSIANEILHSILLLVPGQSINHPKPTQ